MTARDPVVGPDQHLIERQFLRQRLIGVGRGEFLGQLGEQRADFRPRQGAGCRDDFGVTPSYFPPHATPNFPYADGKLTDSLKILMKKVNLDPVFQNYRLVGIQTNFTDPTGQPVLMSTAAESASASCHTRWRRRRNA